MLTIRGRDMLKEKVAMITGGARGIGRDIAATFSRYGAKVALADVSDDALRATVKEIESGGAQAIGVKTDVTDADSVENLIQKTLDNFSRIDILINNAGITRDNLLMRMKEDEWDSVLNVNLKGTFICTKAVSRHMMRQRQGRIINIASIVGIIGNAGQTNYAASKGAVISFTKSAAKELASRAITVNAIAPGFIKTDMTARLSEEITQKMLSLIPLGTFGETADVAHAALFLASDLSRYITGQVIKVDGGMVM